MTRRKTKHTANAALPIRPLQPHTREMLSVLPRRTVGALAVFSAISSIAGGVPMLLFPDGGGVLPLSMLEGSPFSTFLVPGLLLAFVIGGTSTACAVLALRRSPFAIDATVLAGGALTVWIVAEIAMMRSFHWLHALYGGLGLAMLTLGVEAALRSSIARLRWTVSVTFAETLGFAVPGLAGIVGSRAGLDGASLAALVIAAGCVEGFACGAGQAWAMPLPIRRLRFAVWTGVAAGTVWAIAFALIEWFGRAEVGPAWMIVGSVLAAATGLTAIGGAQWIELRHVANAAHRWIGWTALAWVVALPWSFLPGPAVDESTPAVVHFALWSCAGALMAYTLAQITWQGARRLVPRQREAAGFVGEHDDVRELS